MGEQEIRQKYLELQMAAEQMKHMQAQLQAIETKSSEIETNIQSFEDLKGQKNTKLLTPVAEGIFLKAELKSEDELIVNVGAGVCVRKTVEEAKKMLRERQSKLSQYVKELAAEVENAAEAIRKLEEELSRMIKQGENV